LTHNCDEMLREPESPTLVAILKDGARWMMGITSSELDHHWLKRAIKFCPFCGQKLD